MMSFEDGKEELDNEQKGRCQLMNYSFTILACLFVCLAGAVPDDSLPAFRITSGYQFIDDASLPAHIDRDRKETSATILDVKDWTYNPALFAYPEDLESNIWFKFRLNRGALKNGCVLQMYNGLIPLLKVYRKEGNHLALIDSLGSLYPQDQRAHDYRDAVIELPYEEGEATYYFMVYAKYYHGFDIALRTEANLFNYAIQEYYLLGIFYGILMLVLLYNLFHFLMVKDKLYLFYGFYVLMAIISSASTDLTGYWQFWPDFPAVNKFLIDQSKWMLSGALTLYAIYFLRLNRSGNPWLQRVLWSSGAFVFYNAMAINQLLPTRITLFLFLLAMHLLMIWLAAWSRWRSGFRSAGIFLIGLSVLVLAFIGNYLRFWELIPATVSTNFIMHYGIFAEVLVLTYAMSFRFKQERTSRLRALEEKTTADNSLIKQLQLNEELKDKVNRELEDKVREKTIDLQEANEQLHKQSESIRAMNDELARLNGQLYHDKKRQQRARAWKNDLSKEEFFEIFPDKVTCYHLLNDLKSATPYACKKCGHTQYTQGTGLLSRRCTKCGYNESVTTGTLFKGFRSPLPQGFYLVYLFVESRHTLPASELARATGLGTKAAWNLRKALIESSEKKQHTNWMDALLE